MQQLLQLHFGCWLSMMSFTSSMIELPWASLAPGSGPTGTVT